MPPPLVRSLTRDPASPEGGENQYLFCGGNPLTNADASGLDGDGWSVSICGFEFNHDVVSDGLATGLNVTAQKLTYGHFGDAAYNSHVGATGAGYLAIGGRELLIQAAFMGLGNAVNVARAGRAVQAIEATEAVADGFNGLSKASQYGIKGYNALRKLTAGTGLEAHHLIEKRFAGLFGQKVSLMLAVAVTEGEHDIFTAAWRKAFPYGTATATATQKEVWDEARKIYANYPAILKALGLK